MSGGLGDSKVTVASGSVVINALLWDRHWSTPNLTWSMPTSDAAYIGNYTIDGFSRVLAQQETAFREVLNLFSSVSGLVFTQTTSTAAKIKLARADAVDVNGDGDTSDEGEAFDTASPAHPTRKASASICGATSG